MLIAWTTTTLLSVVKRTHDLRVVDLLLVRTLTNKLSTGRRIAHLTLTWVHHWMSHFTRWSLMAVVTANIRLTIRLIRLMVYT